MAELATSPRYRAYLDHLISELDRAMARSGNGDCAGCKGEGF